MRNVVMKKGAESKRASATQGWMQFWNSGSLELGTGQRLHSLDSRLVFHSLLLDFFLALQGFPREPPEILHKANNQCQIKNQGCQGSFSHEN